MIARITLVPVLIVALAVAASAQSPISFKRSFTAGAVEKFEMKSDIRFKMSLMGQTSETTSETTSDYTVTYGEKDDKGHNAVTIKVDNVKGKVESEGETTDIEDSEDMHSEYKGFVNPLMQFIDLKSTDAKEGAADEGAPDFLSGLGDASNTMFMSQYPSMPVKPGDTWEVEVPADGFFEKGQKAKGTYVGLKDFNGASVHVIEYSGDMKLDSEAMKDDSDDVEMKISGTMSLKNTIYIDPKSFITIGSVSDGTGTFKVAIGDFELEMDMSGKTTSVLKP